MLTKGQRLLEAFTTVLNGYDLVRFALNEQPVAYEIEAISLLAVFNEAHVGMLDGVEQMYVAREAVRRTFDRWHGPGSSTTMDLIAADLIKAYCAEPAEG